jgi:hypothetical protein
MLTEYIKDILHGLIIEIDFINGKYVITNHLDCHSCSSIQVIYENAYRLIELQITREMEVYIPRDQFVVTTKLINKPFNELEC